IERTGAAGAGCEPPVRPGAGCQRPALPGCELRRANWAHAGREAPARGVGGLLPCPGLEFPRAGLPTPRKRPAAGRHPSQRTYSALLSPPPSTRSFICFLVEKPRTSVIAFFQTSRSSGVSFVVNSGTLTNFSNFLSTPVLVISSVTASWGCSFIQADASSSAALNRPMTSRLFSAHSRCEPQNDICTRSPSAVTGSAISTPCDAISPPYGITPSTASTWPVSSRSGMFGTPAATTFTESTSTPSDASQYIVAVLTLPLMLGAAIRLPTRSLADVIPEPFRATTSTPSSPRWLT